MPESTTGNTPRVQFIKKVETSKGAVKLAVALNVAASATHHVQPNSSTGNASRVEFKKKLVERSKGAVKLAIIALNVAASATQNVPYLGAISKVLVEISKMVDEVDVCKSTWKTVMSKIREIQKIVDNFREQANREGRSEDELPEVIKVAFKDFEECLFKVIVTMNDCKTPSKLELLFKRSDLTAAANHCEKDIASALTIFQAKLQIDQWNLQRDLGKAIDNIEKAVMPNAKFIAKLNSNVSAPVLPPAPSIFFGRSGEVDEVVNLILNHALARVAIVGTGGIGKTSIALTVIHHSDVQKLFLDQRFFLSCEAILTAESLILELLKLFGLSVEPSSSKLPLNTLVRYVQFMTSKCFLCLDNFETPWDSDKDQVESLLVNIAVSHLTLLITSRDSDRPRGIKWGALKPIQPLTIDAAIATWEAIADSHGHDEFSVLLIKAVECIPLAVTLLAQLAQTDSSKSLWESWNSELTKLIRSDGSAHRLNNLELSIELSLRGPRLQACSSAFDFFIVLCMLPQGMPESRTADFETAFGKDFTGLRSAIRVLKQCSLAYTLDGFLCVLSPIRQYTQSLSTPFAGTLFLRMAEVYLDLIPDDPWQTSSGRRERNLEMANISAVLDMCLDKEQLACVQKTIDFSRVCRNLGVYDTRLLLKAASFAHKHDPALEGYCYREQGVNYFRLDKLPDAEQAFQSALHLHKESGDSLGQANDLQRLGKLYTRLDRLEDAEQALQSALNLHKEIEDKLGQAHDLQGLGVLYTRLNQLEDAERALQSALNLHKEIEDKLGQANDLQALGELYTMLNRLEDAEQALQSALNLDKEIENRLGQANDLRSLGTLYTILNQLEDAERALQSSLNLYKEVESKLGQANALQALGELYKRLNRLEDAERAFQSALDLRKEIHNKLGQGNALQRLGQLYLRLNRLEDSEGAFQSALILHEEITHKLGQAYDLQGLGELYTKLNCLEDAEQALQSALNLHKEIDDKFGEAKDLELLELLHEK